MAAEQSGGWPKIDLELSVLCPSVPSLDSAGFEQEVLAENDPDEIAIIHFLVPSEDASKFAARTLEGVAANGWRVFNVDRSAPASAPIAERFVIGTIPTVLLFRGGSLVSNFAGCYDPIEIGQWAAHHSRITTN